MAQQKLEGELGAAYRLRPSEIREGGRAIFKRSAKGINGSRRQITRKDTAMHSRERPCRLLQSGRRLLQRVGRIRIDAVEEADGGRQVNFVARRTFRRSATASLWTKRPNVSKE